MSYSSYVKHDVLKSQTHSDKVRDGVTKVFVMAYSLLWYLTDHGLWLLLTIYGSLLLKHTLDLGRLLDGMLIHNSHKSEELL